MSMVNRGFLLCCLFLFCLVFSKSVLSDTFLNGVATYTELKKEQFLVGLYLSDPAQTPQSIFGRDQDMRLVIKVSADTLSKRRFRSIWIEGAAINSNSQTLVANAEDMGRFARLIPYSLVKGDVFVLSRSVDNATQVSLNGVELGRFDNNRLFDLLLRVWIGQVPPSSAFRDELVSAGDIDKDLVLRFDQLVPELERIAKVEQYVASLASSKGQDNKKRDEKALAQAKDKKQDIQVIEQVASLPAAAAKVVAPASPKPVEEPKLVTEKALKLNTDNKQDDVVQTVSNAKEPVEQLADNSAESEKSDSSDSDSTVGDVADASDDDAEFSVDAILQRQLYLRNLRAHYNGFLKYPSKAISRGHAGSVTLRIDIDRSGNVLDVVRINESKYGLLNSAATKAARKASPFPAIPDSIVFDRFTFSVPVNFVLN